MMLNLSNLKPKIRRKARKRVGRGLGSGHGAFSGRGIKGQKARTGGHIPPGFEGGRMPFIRQIPKVKGFKSIHPKARPISLKKLVSLFPEGGVVTPVVMAKKGLGGGAKQPVKITGGGEVSVKFEFKGVKLSGSARAAVEKAGGFIHE